jgi:hypothetical protein
MRTTVSRLRGDERGILISWLVRLILSFAVIAVILFDTGSIILNFFSLDSTARDIAVSLSTEVDPRSHTLQDQQILEQQVEELADEAEARMVSVVLEDRAIVVTLRRRAETILVDRIGLIRDWGLATADGRSATQ